METVFLPAAPAILQGCCQYLGLQSRFVDLNLRFVVACQAAGFDYRRDLVGITEHGIPNTDLEVLATELVKRWAQEILAQQPRLVAISVFSYYGQWFARNLCVAIQDQCPGQPIVLGGSGIKASLNSAAIFAQTLRDQGLISEFVDGDGEHSWYDFLIRHFAINSRGDLPVGLDTPYLPCYKDYEFDSYRSFLSADHPQLYIPITGSRGCVRQCDFCEVHQHWPFVQRSAEHIGQEVQHILSLISNPYLHFTDSLINGNLREFNRLLDVMTDLQQQHRFNWGGQFIARSAQQFGNDRWAMMARAGVKNLEIGVETGSDRLRFVMRKNFSNQDLDHVMENLCRHNIPIVMLLMVGHPMETEEDFEQTISMLERYQPYQDLVTLQLNYSFAVQPGTPLHDNHRSLGLMITRNPVIWMNTHNVALTFDQRMSRRQRLHHTAIELGYRLTVDEHVALDEMQHVQTQFQTQIAMIEKLATKQSNQLMQGN